MQFLNEVFIIKGKNNPELHVHVWKTNYPLNLNLTDWATLNSNN